MRIPEAMHDARSLRKAKTEMVDGGTNLFLVAHAEAWDDNVSVVKRVGSACRSCGNTQRPDTTCSHCGGYGLVTGYEGDPTECRSCGNSGAQWPPVCPNCGKYRSIKGWSA